MPGAAFSDDRDKAEATIPAKIVDFCRQLSHSYRSVQLLCVLALVTHHTVLASIWPAVGNGIRKILTQLPQQAQSFADALHRFVLPGLSQVCLPSSTACYPLQVGKVESTTAFLQFRFTQSPSVTEARLVRRRILCVLKTVDRKTHWGDLPRLWHGFRAAPFVPGKLPPLICNPQSNCLSCRSHSMGRG